MQKVGKKNPLKEGIFKNEDFGEAEKAQKNHPTSTFLGEF